MKILRTWEDEREIREFISSTVEPNPEIEASVREILRDVKARGDEALLEYTERFDGAKLTREEIKVDGAEIDGSYKSVDGTFIDAMKLAKQNIEDFHIHQKENSWFTEGGDGAILGQKVMPIENVGAYVPGGTGGKTPLVSSLLMNVIPARVAGVGRVVLCTPPNPQKRINPYMLVAADIVGVREIYKVGGAQAIAAMAYGTESVPRVDKIVGPGNPYVVAAKRLVYGTVGIDMLPGPSEILIIADESANPVWAAADLLSQAEHAGDEKAVLITTSERIAGETLAEIERQLKGLGRRDTVERSLGGGGRIIVARDLDEAVELCNAMAPEHAEIMVEEPFAILDEIRNAGAIFLGRYSTEPIGDYIAGTNHVLPTGGTARFCSPLGVYDFVKRSQVIFYTEGALRRAGPAALRIADVEGLDAHGNAIKRRIES
ncbi:MAG: histidinol dehydrogenase [bacterium]